MATVPTKHEDSSHSIYSVFVGEPSSNSESSPTESRGSSVQKEAFQTALDRLEALSDRTKGAISNLGEKVQDKVERFRAKAQNAVEKFNGDLDDRADSPKSKGSSKEPALTSGPATEGLHIGPESIANTRGLDPQNVGQVLDPANRLGEKGDFLDGGGGTNSIIGAGGDDIVRGDTAGAFNTITTGDGKDLIVLGKEATNRVFDFDPVNDQFGLGDGLNVNDIVFGQGQNPQKGGLDQPLDSENNTVVIDRTSEHILASLTFVNSDSLSEKNFVTVPSSELDKVASAGAKAA